MFVFIVVFVLSCFAVFTTHNAQPLEDTKKKVKLSLFYLWKKTAVVCATIRFLGLRIHPFAR